MFEILVWEESSWLWCRFDVPRAPVQLHARKDGDASAQPVAETGLGVAKLLRQSSIRGRRRDVRDFILLPRDLRGQPLPHDAESETEAHANWFRRIPKKARQTAQKRNAVSQNNFFWDCFLGVFCFMFLGGVFGCKLLTYRILLSQSWKNIAKSIAKQESGPHTQ